MKILLVNTFYYPNMQGGTEHSVKLLAENLLKRGHDVAVYSVDTNKNMIIENINGVKVYRCKAGYFSIEDRISNDTKKVKKLKNKVVELRNYSIKKNIQYIINDFKPDIVHTNNIYGISPYIWKILSENNIKIIHTIRDYWIASPTVKLENKNLIYNAMLEAYKCYFRNCTRYIDYVTAPSKFTLNTFKNFKYFKKSKFKHIDNSICIDYELLDKVIKKRINNYDKIINFIFVGMINEMKGIDKLLLEFNKNKDLNIRLNVFGTGNLDYLVKQYCNKDSRIKFYGKVSKEKLANEFQKNDVLIIPSMWDEPFGRVVIEANQFGLPVIGSNRGGIKEIIDNINTGELFDSDNIEELGNLIKYFSERDNIKKYYNNIKKNIHVYSIERQIDNFLKIYNN